MALRSMSVDIDFGIDLSAITKLDSSIDETVNSVTGGMNKAGKSVDGLGDDFKDVTGDAKKVAKAVEDVGDSGDGIDDVAKKMGELGDSAKDAEGKVGGLSETLSGGLKAGLAGIGVAAAGLVAGFLATGEASQETMEDMGKLETAFTTSGHSAEAGMKSYEGLVGLLGETDQAVEAANHLAKLTDNEEDLATWTDICTGVYATFGDSLPIEGLTEAA